MLVTLREQRVKVSACSKYTQKEPLLVFSIDQVNFVKKKCYKFCFGTRKMPR